MKTITLLLVLIISVQLNAQIAEIPFELKNGLILLDVTINDNTEASTFVFDTGATSDLLDSTTASKLGLKANYKQVIKKPTSAGDTYIIAENSTSKGGLLFALIGVAE